MGTFLAAVAAVFAGLALFALCVLWWLKRWFRRKVGDYMLSARLVDPRYARPPRIRMEPSEGDPPGPAFEAAWAACHALGFRALADWREANGAFAFARAARLDRLPVGLVLATAGDDEDATSFAMFVLTEHDRLVAFSDAQAPALESETIGWRVEAGLAPGEALQRLEAFAAHNRLRALDLRLIEGTYEHAWAARMDADLARPPVPEALEARTANGTTPAQRQQAHAMELEQWLDQVATAVLDRYRRASRIDAVAWERVREDIHVVHDHLPPERIAALLGGDEAIEALVRQFREQGHTGIGLYEKVLERSPMAQLRRRLGRVDRPVYAAVYGRDEREPTVAAPEARAFPYSALDADGRQVHGAVFAQGTGDAHRQLEAMGLAEARVLSEPVGSSGDGLQEFSVDPELAGQVARAMREPFWLAALRVAWGNKWLWGPPALLLAWSLIEGPPYGGGDYVVFGYATLAAIGFALIVAPMFLYNRLLLARVQARWGLARRLLGLLAALNRFGAMTRAQLEGERCKIDAAAGGLDGALARWRRLEPELPPEDYAQGLVGIYDAVGDHARLIEAQRRFLSHTASKELAKIDLALSLAKQREIDEAETLLAQASPADLSELARGGHHFARGLVCAERGQFDLALRQFGQALERVQQFRSTPLIGCLIAEINGYAALTLRRSGRREEAERTWRPVRDLLARHAGCRGLVERYEQA